MKVIVIGANNSGKGTLVKKIAAKTQLDVIGCSSELAKRGFDIATGKLLPDDLVIGVMKEYLKGKDNIILDGYPRTLKQNEFMCQTLFKPSLIIVMNISEKEVLNRAVGRRVCPNCGEIYNLNGFKLPKEENKCDKCQSLLVHRDDDKEKSVRARYNEYKEKTEPIVSYYKKNKVGPIVWEFDSSDNVDEISDIIAEYINYMNS